MIKRITTIAVVSLVVLIITGVISMLPRDSNSLTGDSDFLEEDDDYSLVFIYYPCSTSDTYRYVLYPDRTIVHSYGLRKNPQVENPVCFEEIKYASTRSVSYIRYGEILRLANNIDDSINTSIAVSFGACEFFVVYNGNYYHANTLDLSEENYEVLDKLRKIFGAPKPEDIA